MHKLQLKLSDGQLNSTKDILVNITNTAPYFKEEPIRQINLKFNNTFEYELPELKDDEGNYIYISLSCDPVPVSKFIFLTNRNKTLFIYPKYWAQLGTFIINIKLADKLAAHNY